MQIRPILADRCFNCHGADEKSREADLRLDVPESATDPKLGAIVPGKPDESELIYRIFETDPDEVMPPPDHPVQLKDSEKQILKQWIAEGAKYEGHWAFTRAERSEPRGPATIDRFIDQRLKAASLQREPEAPRARSLPPGRIITFLKAPRPGQVKSRLAAALDGPAAAAIYQVLLARTISALRDFHNVGDIGRICA